MKLLFERSRPGRGNDLLPPCDVPVTQFDPSLLRGAPLRLPEIAEVDLGRHYTELAKQTHGVNDGFYPLGSCTMKYNPRVNEEAAAQPGFTQLHPLQPVETVQGALEVLATAERLLCEITGMDGMSFQPAAGAHGEYTGLLLIRKYHQSRGDAARTKILVPDAAHGTNPASATMAGFQVVSIPSNQAGGVDMDTLTLCGLLHDIGKSKIPNEIIGKPGKLTDSEYEEIKKHPVIGYNLVKNLDIDQRIKNAVLLHHERFDGKGYPLGLTGNEIDDFTSIVSIADVYDAMTANRCYRDGLCPFEVIAIFEKEGLTQFNPKYILTFLDHIANTYINNEVLLSDGSSGKIVLINKKLTRPTIQLDNGNFVNLESRLDLYVQAII